MKTQTLRARATAIAFALLAFTLLTTLGPAAPARAAEAYDVAWHKERLISATDVAVVWSLAPSAGTNQTLRYVLEAAEIDVFGASGCWVVQLVAVNSIDSGSGDAVVAAQWVVNATDYTNTGYDSFYVTPQSMAARFNAPYSISLNAAGSLLTSWKTNGAQTNANWIDSDQASYTNLKTAATTASPVLGDLMLYARRASAASRGAYLSYSVRTVIRQ